MPQTFVVKAVRPQDLLELIFEFVQVDFVPPAAGQPGQVSWAAAVLPGGLLPAAAYGGRSGLRKRRHLLPTS
jgi:hypothetical protein